MTPGYLLLKAENIRTLSLESYSVGTSLRLDALWMSGTWLQILPHPGWSGYMSKMHSSNTEDSIITEEEESSTTLLHAVDIGTVKIKRRLQPVGEIIGTWGL